ncbi:REDY-like protein HapK [Hyphomonas sp.]|uniref:REDY-like protein HapK n=1 Tax=Hyphomonas sp. TaxID=87 RepID=UPI002602110A|nr:REDY-like protein HapK [Hyphomonas sp.]
MKATLFAAAAALLLSACQTASEAAPQAQPAVERIEIIKEVQVETTPNLFILYTLKEGVTPEQFENWVVTTDQPAMRSLARVQSFRTYRAERLLMGEGAPGVGYIEAFAIPDLEGFTTEDMGGETVQKVMGEFMGLVEAPQFIIVSEVK